MDLSKIYSLRQKFTIIAITGQTGSGCTEVAEQLTKGFEYNTQIFPAPNVFRYDHNSYRKYRIVYDFASKNFKKFEIIYYKDILLAFILKYSFQEFISFLESGVTTGSILKSEFEKSQLQAVPNFKNEIIKLKELEELFSKVHEIAKKIINTSKKSDTELADLFNFFELPDFKELCIQINTVLRFESLIKRNKTLQIIANNMRGFGHPYKGERIDIKNIYTIAEIINDLIKAIKNNKNEENTEIVIDSLRNPFEIMFFKQRYSAFYTLAINRKDDKRKDAISKIVGEHESEDMYKILKEEHSGVKVGEFYKQNVSFCIQNADIHLAFKTKEEAVDANRNSKKKKENVSPYYSWGMQLLKYIALIDHPGIVTPSPEERCMQLAYTAKYNSGCISRQVGAAITDENYSIRSIGWNNTPEGHVPCSLRNTIDLIKNNKDISAFTPFEKSDKEFRLVLLENYEKQIQTSKKKLNGQHVCFCFKSLINSYADGKNQVHTRSLHAEESAFLQITKYGGLGIQNGKLFTSASPCELCSKKAYQLGIKVIYYIDPYPGISISQILTAGKEGRNPEIRLFDGAIGNAYHWLYEPIMPYKDELALILGHDIKDLTKKYKEHNIDLQEKYDELGKDNLNILTKLKELGIEYNSTTKSFTEN